MTYDLHHADILEWAAAYDGPKFHALLCDPPYHLTEITKRFGSPVAAPAQFGSDGAFQRASKGFMGKTWDGGDIAFRPETWAALAEHLYPGAFGMAFASSRGWHRMAVAIEDAGLIIHPVIMCWSFGSGFPKATRIDTQVDRRAGAERPVRGQRKHQPKFAAAELGYREKDNGFNSKDRLTFADTAPATPLAAAWEGHRYGLQALKPALEPVIVFQKPYSGRPVDCITATGAGAINIDGARIGTDNITRHGRSQDVFGFASPEPGGRSWTGRWPANLALVHSPRCDAAGCADECPVRRLGAQSGESTSPQMVTRGLRGEMFAGLGVQHNMHAPGDTGTAARYVYNADWMAERLEAADPVGYFAKASRAEREAGLDPLQLALLGADPFAEATVGDGRQTPIDNPYQRGETTRRNIHPTIKPIGLTRWLATLLLPPAAYAPDRRLLVPFAGVGSEMIGAMLAEWDVVTGLEREAEHVEIGRARLAYWQQRAGEFAAGQDITIRSAPETPDGQMSIFDLPEAA